MYKLVRTGTKIVRKEVTYLLLLWLLTLLSCCAFTIGSPIHCALEVIFERDALYKSTFYLLTYCVEFVL